MQEGMWSDNCDPRINRFELPRTKSTAEVYLVFMKVRT